MPTFGCIGLHVKTGEVVDSHDQSAPPSTCMNPEVKTDFQVGGEGSWGLTKKTRNTESAKLGQTANLSRPQLSLTTASFLHSMPWPRSSHSHGSVRFDSLLDV